MNNDKKTTILWIVIVILVAIIALGVGIYLGGKGKEEKKEEPKTEEKTEINDTSKPVSKDDKLYKEIVEKVDKLTSMDYPVGEKLFEKSRDLADFEEVDLISVAMQRAKKQEMGGFYCYNNKTNKLVDESKCDEKCYSEIESYVKYADMAKIYKDLFNKELEKKDTLDYCPMILYDKKIDGFYLAYPCGGTGYSTEYHYTYDVRIDGDKVYAYVAYGIEDCCSETPDLYTDYAKEHRYKGEVSGDFEINEDNYKEFSKYKIIFEKADDNYYFSRIELN